jgi:hypothetical protein
MPADSEHVDFNRLIPELPLWNNGGGVSIETWIGCLGNYEHAIAYAQLFWPRFVEHDERIFLAHGFAETAYESCLRNAPDNKRGVQALLNHRHIADYFVNTEPGPTLEMILYFGRLLKETWEAKLQRDYPDRQFTVDFSEEPAEDLLAYEITFFEE